MHTNIEANEINMNLAALKTEIKRKSRLSVDENMILDQWFTSIDEVFSIPEDLPEKCKMYDILNAMAEGGTLIDPYNRSPYDRDQSFKPGRFTYKQLAFEKRVLEHLKAVIAEEFKVKRRPVPLKKTSDPLDTSEYDLNISPIPLDSDYDDNTEEIFDPHAPDYRFIPPTVKNYVEQLVMKEPQTWPPILSNVSNLINWVKTKNVNGNLQKLINFSTQSN